MFKKYPFLTGLLMLIASVALLFVLHIINGAAAGVLLICGQGVFFALSKPRHGVFYVTTLSQEMVDEFEEILQGIRGYIPDIKTAKEKVAQLERLYDNLNGELRKLRKHGFTSPNGVRWINDVPFVSDDCAKAITSVFVLDAARLENGLHSMIPDESKRKHIIEAAARTLGFDPVTRAGGALTPTDIPLPTIYAPQIIELVFAYGAARKYATVFPLGAGTVKLPRLKAGEDEFGYIGAGTGGQSQNIPQKEVTAELVTFTANKMGGLIRIPYELEEDTFVPIGQFLARYVARQFAKQEDKSLFLADGSNAYASMTGVEVYCSNNNYAQVLAAGKVKPSDATLQDFRAMRGLVNPAVLANMAANGQTNAAYYLHPSFEPVLRGFNQYPNFVVFTNENGKPMFDGWPVRWIGVGQTFSTNAAPGATLARFGDLSFWYLGERGSPRVEVSKEVFFATDELAMRALERIDVECLGIDAMSILQTAKQ